MTRRIQSTRFHPRTWTSIFVVIAFGLGCFMNSATHSSPARDASTAITTADEDRPLSASAFGTEAMTTMSTGAFRTTGTVGQTDDLPACSATAGDAGETGVFHFMLSALKIMADGAFGHQTATTEGEAKPCIKTERKGLFGFMLNALGIMSDATFGEQRAPVELATPAPTLQPVAPRIKSNCQTAVGMHVFPDGISRRQYVTTCE